MRATRCDEVGAIIDRESHGLSAADRLSLEQHVGTCASCREELAASRFVRDTLERAPRLTETARVRALSRALAAQDHAAPSPSRVSGPTRPWLAAGAVFAAAAAALLVYLVATPAPNEMAQAPAARPPRPLAAAPRAPAPSAPVEEPAWIESSEAEERTFAHARVGLAPKTRVRFDEARATLALSGGRVDVEVDASRARPFAVTTQHFRVEVLGTHFVVTPDSVEVLHGRVQVVGLDGEVLARDLAAGATFSYAPARAAPPPPAKHEAPARASVRELLGQARLAMGHDDLTRARELVSRAEASHPSRPDRAEALTLRAELSLLAREPRAAIDYYEKVARGFADLPAGENAAYAAAQLAAKSAPAREAALLRSYLERHPRGRFAREAQQRLDHLGAP